jgi:hypothetical protein
MRAPIGPVGLTGLDGLVEAAALTGDPDQSPLVFVDLDDLHDVDPASLDRVCAALAGRAPVTVGLASAPVPAHLEPLLQALTTSLAPAGPGRAWAAAESGAARRIDETVTASPLAAITLANLLPAVSRVTVPDGLQLESLAYSMLLAGPEFAAWRERTPRHTDGDRRSPAVTIDDPVILDRDAGMLTITLNRPARHNAFGTAVRDGLINGLELARIDPTLTEVIVRGAGRSFCSGGDLDEFGTASDPATAHLIRLAHSAGFLVHELRDRVRVEVHGACIGAGVEVPSFAGRVVANEDAFFQLPELTMGLIPGAGGTVSITHRIGRWRTAFLALTGDRVPVQTALAWGLVDARA